MLYKIYIIQKIERSLTQHINYFNFRSKIQLDHPELFSKNCFTFNGTIIPSYHKTTRLSHEMGEDEFWIYDDDDDEDENAFGDENWEYFDEAAAAAEEATKPQFLKGREKAFFLK